MNEVNSSAEHPHKIGHWPISILNGMSAIVALFLPILMSRFLSPDDIGRYKILFLYLMTVPAVSLTGGIENGLYYWAGLGSDGKPLVRSGWSLTLAHSLFFALIVLLAFPWLPTWLNWTPRESLAFLFASFTVALSTFFEALLIARKKIWAGAFFSSGFDSIKTFSILGSVLYFKTAESTVWAYGIASGIKIIASILFGFKDGWIPLWPDFSSAKQVMKYSLPVSISGIFDLFMNYSDRFLLSVIITPAQFAMYTFGCLALPPLQIIERSVNKVLIPKLTMAIKNEDRALASLLYNKAIEQIMMIYIPSVVGLFVFAEPIIRLLFTDKYLEASEYLRIYAFWYLISAIPYDVGARASGNGKWILKTNAIMGVFSFTLCGIMTWLWGTHGALLALIFSAGILRLFGYTLMLKTFSWSLSKMIPQRSIFLFSILSLFLGIISYLLKSYFVKDIFWLLVCGGCFAIIYLVSLFILRRDLFGVKLPFNNDSNV
jgi:O-antigen/teichoic acid export membrane protein